MWLKSAVSAIPVPLSSFNGSPACSCQAAFLYEDQAAKLTRDPVAPAKRSEAAEIKAQTHLLEDGTPAHSFATLLQELSTIVRNRCTAKGSSSTFDLLSTPNLTQRRALDLVAKIEV